MVKTVGVRFKKAGKIYYFDPDELEINAEDNVIVETIRGIEFGEVVLGVREVPEEQIVAPLKKVLRVATEEDKKIYWDNKNKEKDALAICLQKIQQHNLNMKLIDVEYTFDNNKIIFYFTADGRVDFRELVKDLASVFKTRIELRQIGVRDESKMIGGVGPCGRALCCSSFLGDFAPVSIKMAKEQSLSLNPAKISGICGRLMCCLKYEQEAYEYARRIVPRVGSIVDTPEGKGEVVGNNILKEQVKVMLEIQENNMRVVKDYSIKDVVVIKQGRGDVDNPIIDEDVKLEDLKMLEKD